MKIPVAVADTGPLHYLALIDRTDILQHLFGTILVPGAVRAELLHPNSPSQAKSFINTPFTWLQFAQVQHPSNLSTIVQRGEAETIAIEKGAQSVLIDDSQGRKLAHEFGLSALGTVGILEIAAGRNLIDLPTALEALRKTNIFIAESILVAALQRDESRRARR